MIESIGDESAKDQVGAEEAGKARLEGGCRGNHNIANRGKWKIENRDARGLSTMAQRVEELQKMMDELVDVELDVEKDGQPQAGELKS